MNTKYQAFWKVLTEFINSQKVRIMEIKVIHSIEKWLVHHGLHVKFMEILG